MTKSDLETLFSKNWRFLFGLPVMAGRNLRNICIVDPEDKKTDARVAFAYDDFCQKLGFKKKPLIIVVNEKGKRAIGKNVDAAFSPACDVVWMQEKIYDGLVSSDPYSFYVVAHELGHRKDSYKLINLAKAGAAVGCGPLVGIIAFTIAEALTGWTGPGS